MYTCYLLAERDYVGTFIDVQGNEKSETATLFDDFRWDEPESAWTDGCACSFDFAAGGYTLLLMPKDDNLSDMGLDEPYQDTFPVTYIDDPNVLALLQKSMVYEREELDTLHYCHPNLAILVCKNGESQELISMSRNCSAVFSSKGRFENQAYFDHHQYPLADHRLDVFPNVQRAHQVLDSMRLFSNLIWYYEPEWRNFEGKFRFNQYDPKANVAQVTSSMRAMIEKIYPGEAFELQVIAEETDDFEKMNGWGGNFTIVVTCNESLFLKFGDNQGDKSGFEAFRLQLESYWR